jgi:hypothetical protein
VNWGEVKWSEVKWREVKWSEAFGSKLGLNKGRSHAITYFVTGTPLAYNNAYLFINVVVIVFIPCRDPFILWVVLFSLSVNWPYSCVILCDMCYLFVVTCICLCMLFIVSYCIATATRLTTHLQYNSIQFNSIQFFIIYVPSQQLHGQLQTQHSTDIHNYIMDTHNIKSRVNCRST